jgi:hypothetical protein
MSVNYITVLLNKKMSGELLIALKPQNFSVPVHMLLQNVKMNGLVVMLNKSSLLSYKKMITIIMVLLN